MSVGLTDITIYRNGDELVTIPVTSACNYHKEIMTSEYIELEYNLPSNAERLENDDYITYNGRTFYVIQPNNIEVVNSGGIRFKQKFYAGWERWRNAICFYDRSSSIEAGWGMTNNASAFMEIVVSNIASAGYGTFTYYIDTDVVKDLKYINVEGGMDIVSVLNAIAEAWNCEWWVDGNIIKLGNLSMQTYALTVTEGSNAKKITVQTSQGGGKVTRLYAFGSDRNISERYRKDLTFAVGEATMLQKMIDNKPSGYTAAIIDNDRRITPEMFPSAVQSYEDITNSLSGSITTEHHDYEDGDFEVNLRTNYPINVTKDGDYNINFINNSYIRLQISGQGTITCTKMKIKLQGDNGTIDEFEQPVSLSSSGTTDVAIDPNLLLDFSAKDRRTRLVIVTIPYHRTAPVYTNVSTSRLVVSAHGTVRVRCKNPSATLNLNIGNSNYEAVLNPLHRSALDDLAYMIAFNGTQPTLGTKFKIANIITARVPLQYYTGVDASAINAVAKRNLLLPNEPCWKDNQGNIYRQSELESTSGYTKVYKGGGYIDTGAVGARVEGVALFNDIYPRQEAIISDIIEDEITQWDEENQVEKKHIEYLVKADSLTDFNEDWLLDGVELKITMQTELLAGMTFDCKLEDVYNSTSGQYETYFRIIRNESDYGVPVPNANIQPTIGAKFILSGFDIAYVDNSLVADAEVELLSEAIKYLAKKNEEADTYTCEMLANSVSIIPVGYPITINTANVTGVRTRVRAFDISLDGFRRVFTCGKAASASRFANIETTIDGLIKDTEVLQQQSNAYAPMVTKAELNAVIRTLKADIESTYLNKTKEDTAEELIRLKKGFVAGEANGTNDFQRGFNGCKLYWDGSSWNLQVDRLQVTKTFEAKEVQVDEVTHVGGQMLLTSARCVCDYVEKYGSTGNKYNIYFLKKDNSGKAIKNDWEVGDLAYCQMMNVDTGNSTNFSNKYYWVKVVAVGANTTHHYIRVDFAVSDGQGEMAVNDTYGTLPQPNDNIVQLGHIKQSSESVAAANKRNGAVFISGGEAGQYIAIFADIYNSERAFVLPTAKVMLSPELVSIIADEIHLSSNGVLELSSNQLTCTNSEHEKTFWLDERGNANLRGRLNKMAIDVVGADYDYFFQAVSRVDYEDGEGRDIVIANLGSQIQGYEDYVNDTGQGWHGDMRVPDFSRLDGVITLGNPTDMNEWEMAFPFAIPYEKDTEITGVLHYDVCRTATMNGGTKHLITWAELNSYVGKVITFVNQGTRLHVHYPLFLKQYDNYGEPYYELQEYTEHEAGHAGFTVEYISGLVKFTQYENGRNVTYYEKGIFPIIRDICDGFDPLGTTEWGED